MYLVGAPHPHKANAQRLLEKLITDRQRLVTDAEFLQEISAPLCRNRSPLYSVRSRLSWSIDSCLPVMLCIYPSWSKTESIES